MSDRTPTTEEFDATLLGLLETMTASQIIDIPGVYEALSEEMNNDVVDTWRENQDDDEPEDDDGAYGLSAAERNPSMLKGRF